MARIERALGSKLPRVKLAEFDYEARPAERLEVPQKERLAAHRARQAKGRARAAAKAAKADKDSKGEGSSRPRRRRFGTRRRR